ncbi:MAG: hypothetical protein RMX65_021365 [Nostoc sp. DedQUE01]|nr:hypothetical protein [Nostoc sp. DedQUE01]
MCKVTFNKNKRRDISRLLIFVVCQQSKASNRVISSSDNHLLLKFLRVPASRRPRVSPNDKSSPEHDIKYFIFCDRKTFRSTDIANLNRNSKFDLAKICV